uniref:Uncharacterized protein n=1 Tax=viral metagenome TaxID=1070528 RepID=A0A6C0CA73_9ZZZZ
MIGKHHINNYTTLTINDISYSLHNDLIKRINIFNALDDCDDKNLKLSVITSRENVECALECLHNEDFRFKKKMKDCMESFLFVTHLDADDKLCTRVLNKMDKTGFTFDEFVNAGADYVNDDGILTFFDAIYLWFKYENNVAEFLSNNKLILNFPFGTRLHIVTKILDVIYQTNSYCSLSGYVNNKYASKCITKCDMHAHCICVNVLPPETILFTDIPCFQNGFQIHYGFKAVDIYGVSGSSSNEYGWLIVPKDMHKKIIEYMIKIIMKIE